MAETQEPGPRDFHAQARLLLRQANTASLATAQAGIPHAAFVTVAWLDLQPVLLLSELGIHTRQLNANPACALLITGRNDSPNPQTAPRLCLTGNAVKTADPQARSIFLQTHPYADLYADFADFAFWRIALTQAYYVGGFGAARHLDVETLIATW